MSTKQDLVAGIIDFLKRSVADGTVDTDNKDSVDVAIDCLSDVFGVDAQQASAQYAAESLEDILKNYRAGKSSAAASAPPPAASSKPKELNPEAEALKAEGNTLLARKDFVGAIAAYTKAIALDPSNAIYYSNRAAAHSSNKEPEAAVVDANKAIELDPSYSRGYSRLGLALYSLGDAEGSMKAYEKGLSVEGDNKSDGMKRGYEAAKKRFEEDQAVQKERSADTAESPSGSAPSGGMPDLSSLLGGAGGGGLADMMKNPMIQQAAQSLMSNPNALSEIMNNPMIQNMKKNMENGETPDFAAMMNNPMLQNMAKNFGLGGDQSK